MDVDQAVIEELSSLLPRDRQPRPTSDSSLRDLGFRSIDFAALALRLEERAGRELDLSAGDLSRSLATVGDLQVFFRAVLAP